MLAERLDRKYPGAAADWRWQWVAVWFTKVAQRGIIATWDIQRLT
jgi:hypothetical protein